MKTQKTVDKTSHPERKLNTAMSPWVIIVMVVFDTASAGALFASMPFLACGSKPHNVGISLSVSSAIGAVSQAPLGRLSDLHGRKSALLLMQMCSFAGFLILLLLPKTTLVITFSAALVAVNKTFSVARALVSDSSDDANRATVIGKIGMGVGSGFILGPFVAGELSKHGHTAPVLACAFFAAINLGFTAVCVQSTPKPAQEQPQSQNNGAPDSLGSKGAVAAALRAFRKPSLLALFTVRLVTGLGFYAVTSTLATYTSSRFGFTQLEHGRFLSFIGFSFAVVQGVAISPCARWLSEPACIVVALVTLAAARLGQAIVSTVPMLMLCMIAVAFGGGLNTTMMASSLTKHASPGDRGYILGLSETIDAIARSVMPVPGSYVAQVYGPAAPMLLSSACMMVSLLLFLALHPRFPLVARPSIRKVD